MHRTGGKVTRIMLENKKKKSSQQEARTYKENNDERNYGR